MARRATTAIVAELKLTGSLQPFEKEYFRKDGSRVPVLIGAATFEGGGDQGVAFVLDLTERKRAEEALATRAGRSDLAHMNRLSDDGRTDRLDGSRNQSTDRHRAQQRPCGRSFFRPATAGPGRGQGSARLRRGRC